MLTYDQKQTLCLLHQCLVYDSLFELSPLSRINIHANVSADTQMHIQLLHAHFQNFIAKSFPSFEEGIRMSGSVSKSTESDIKYRDRSFLRRTVVECIERLMGLNPQYESDIDRFIFGYSSYIPSKAMRKAIGNWFLSKDRTLFFLWDMF